MLLYITQGLQPFFHNQRTSWTIQAALDFRPRTRVRAYLKMAGGVRFERTEHIPMFDGFQDRCIQPLYQPPKR